DIGVVEATVHEVHRFALEGVESWGERLARHHGSKADGIQRGHFAVRGHRVPPVLGLQRARTIPLVPDQLDFAILRSRSAAALIVYLVYLHTPRAAASLGPRLARNLARHSAGARSV